MKNLDKVIVIGGGIIGLSCAFYLRQAGREVVVVDRGDLTDGCSYGNAGYVSPSHFIPMAAPGVLSGSLKWLMDPKSPLYIEPRLNWNLISWGIQFLRKANAEHVKRSAPALRDILLLSRSEYAEWAAIPGFEFAFDPCGMLELYQDIKGMEHAHHTAKQASELGLSCKVLNAAEAQAMEPDMPMKVSGGLFFEQDAQLYPPKLMAGLLKWLDAQGVTFMRNTEVMGFVESEGNIKAIQTNRGDLHCGQVVVATGSWTTGMGKALGLKLPIVGGRGYSFTLENPPVQFRHSVILEDARVAISPMDGNKLRFGGTMEITRHGKPPRMERVKGIVEGVNRFFPEMHLQLPAPSQVWHGYRPVSHDGLPFIGFSPRHRNLVIAAGHAMLGLSMGPATGKLVVELLNGLNPSIDLKPFGVTNRS